MPREKMFDVEIKVLISSGWLEKLREKARRDGVPVSHLVRLAISNYVMINCEEES